MLIAVLDDSLELSGTQTQTDDPVAEERTEISKACIYLEVNEIKSERGARKVDGKDWTFLALDNCCEVFFQT